MPRQKDEVKFSSTTARKAKDAKLKIRELAFADLIASGWKEFDAFMITLYDAAYTGLANKQAMHDILCTNTNLANYIKRKTAYNSRKEQKTDLDENPAREQAEAIDVAAELTKEQQLTDLIRARKKHPTGSKEWIDLSKLIADITQAKKDEIKEEDTTIHYYLPLSCRDCSLYATHQAKLKSD